MFLPAVNGGQTFIPKRDCKKCVCVCGYRMIMLMPKTMTMVLKDQDGLQDGDVEGEEEDDHRAE